MIPLSWCQASPSLEWTGDVILEKKQQKAINGIIHGLKTYSGYASFPVLGLCSIYVNKVV